MSSSETCGHLGLPPQGRLAFGRLSVREERQQPLRRRSRRVVRRSRSPILHKVRE